METADIEFERIRRGIWAGPYASKPYVAWNDLSRILSTLVKWSRVAKNRKKFDEVVYNSFKELLEKAKGDIDTKIKALSTLTQQDVDVVTVTIIATANIVRVLRNSVVDFPTNQFLQVKTGLLDTIMESIGFYHNVSETCRRAKFRYPYALTYSPLCYEVMRACLQVTSNLCVGNQAVQGAVWSRLYPGMFTTLLESSDKTVKNYVCSILFHCVAWRASTHLEKLFISDAGKNIVRNAVALVEQPNCLEWAQILIEGLICADKFIDLHDICKESQRTFTLLERFVIQ